MSAIITIETTIGTGYQLGDYARLYGNGGSGSVDWDDPVTAEVLDLFPNGAGLYGYGHGPYGHFRYGHAHASRAPGYGHLPYGHGAVVLIGSAEVSGCGDYIFAFGCYDSAGNCHSGTPDELTVTVHMAPAAPTNLKFNSYNQTTDVLTLDAA